MTTLNHQKTVLHFPTALVDPPDHGKEKQYNYTLFARGHYYLLTLPIFHPETEIRPCAYLRNINTLKTKTLTFYSYNEILTK